MPDASPPSELFDTLHAVFAHVSDGIVVSDADGQVLEMNPAALALHGFTDASQARMHRDAYRERLEVLGLDGTALPPDAWPLARVLRGERFETALYRVRRRDADVEWVGAYSGAPVYEDDVLSRAILVIRDETERFEAQQALIAQHHLLDALLAQMPVGVVVVEVDSGLQVVSNAEADRLLGARTGGAQAVYPGGAPYPAHELPLARALQGEVVRREEVCMRYSDGAEATLAFSASPVRDAAGDLEYALATIYDVTDENAARSELEAAKERAEAAVAARDDVFAIVTHDLRNPLSTIAIAASALQGEVSDELRPYVDLLREASEQMRAMLQDLLDVSRLERGQRLSVAPRPVLAAELLDASFRQLEAQVDDAGLTLHLVPCADALVVRADAHRVSQIFANLVGNAIKFTPEGGEITLSATRAGSSVRFSVRDTGRGLAPEAAARAFEPFWQGQNDMGGQGLGLAIVRALVEAQNGEVDLRAVEGGGTAVRFTLPLAEDA